jgi:hypothetical protein
VADGLLDTRVMRSILVLLASIGLLGASFVLARSTTAQPPTGQRATLEDSVLCVERAQHETDLVPGQIRRLCIATPSPRGPLDCYLEARRTLALTDQQRIDLCRCSADAAPAQCVHALRDRALMTDPEMVAMCSPTLTLGLRVDCTPVP